MAPIAPPPRPAAPAAPPLPAAPAPLSPTPPHLPSIAGLRASQSAITEPSLAPLRTPPAAPAPPPLPVPPAPPPAAAGVGALRTPAPAAPPVPEPRKTGPLRPVNPFLVQDPRQKARRLARALISDMLVYHPEKRQQGIRDGTLPQLFRDEIEKSWLEYVEQVGKDMADTTPFWTDALNEILAGGKKLF
ncbi:MAG TPA: hypothetical protein VFI79_15220 [Gemmatimonadales bacterium]|nr:hypothetical protein [Gemmatimonadales bacterium]